ncbi:bifunctional helix-turn-helix transcriptional regulator/GNAT family N-acetyltransferase [Actinophytocola oryzae]|uniref:MarR family transcriptional regulator with acetyltransferase activity n=1 Tax=Actinophytocola oryzae TaxID=502181 RepID=A0A4R7VN41_9PSEU|nr:helix-turn-helix domain-containing GNAT family N-acetyltransferase [Actinophytocola oryzae]TDV50755.1 MarR family transcriptional regulator with acetyltransferase activity [Actinophytocola oryzae]
MIAEVPAERIAAVRAFNRSYTSFLDALNEHHLHTPYSLTEARVLYELSQRDETEVAALRQATGLDAGYLSRLLTRFEGSGLVHRDRSGSDARRQVIRLTTEGREAFRVLDTRTVGHIHALLADLGDDEQLRLLDAMDTIRRRIDRPTGRPDVTLRHPEPGDFGWVIERNGALYAAEHGFDSSYEALVAHIVADYLDAHDPECERAWVAELHGERVGAVFCVREDDTTARLRLLHVEPTARGAGVGTVLVDECVQYAQAAGYRAMELWTVSVLTPARRIYQRAGFELVEEDAGPRFGRELTGQTWRLDLGRGQRGRRPIR